MSSTSNCFFRIRTLAIWALIALGAAGCKHDPFGRCSSCGNGSCGNAGYSDAGYRDAGYSHAGSGGGPGAGAYNGGTQNAYTPPIGSGSRQPTAGDSSSAPLQGSGSR